MITQIAIGEIQVLNRPIDNYLENEAHQRTREQMYTYKRLKNSEILLSKAVFIRLGLCQPAWVTLEASQAYSHIAVAYMNQQIDDEEDKMEDQIWLSPMLSRAFDGTESIVVYKNTEQIQSGPRCIQSNIEGGPAVDIMHWQATGLPTVAKLCVEVLHSEL